MAEARSRAKAREVLLEELSHAARVDLSGVGDSAALREEIPIDSLALLDVFLRVEERLAIEIDEDALGSVRTVGDLVDCIAEAPAAE